MSRQKPDSRSGARNSAAGKAAGAAKKGGAKKIAKKKATRKDGKDKGVTAKAAAKPTAAVKDADAEARGRTAKKVERLPAFGFAEDLLRELKGQPAAAASPARREEPARPSKNEAPGTGDGAPREPAAEDDPERIFAFADTLEEDDATEAPESTPARITSWVTFDLAGEVYALPVEPVREVLRVASVTRVPHAPRPIRGVTNLRGRVIPVIDLRVRIGLEASSIERSTRVIVVASRGRLLGLLVDAVHQVVHIDLNQVQPPPDDVMTVQSDYISGVYHLGDQLILLLDVDRALVVRDDPEAEDPPRQSGAA